MDVLNLSDEDVAKQSNEPKTVSKEIPVPSVGASTFHFYQADAASPKPGQWRCIVQAGALSWDVCVEDACSVDFGATMSRIWLHAVGT